MPTVLLYVVDTPRCRSPATFASNMLYACSVMFRTKLPMVLVFNKTDVEPHEFAVEWLRDLDAFQQGVEDDDQDAEGGYMSSFTSSLGLVLNEFYETLECVGVSSATGQGMEALQLAISKAVSEYNSVYLPEIRSRLEQVQKQADQLGATPFGAASQALPPARKKA